MNEKTGEAFGGRIARTVGDSEPWWPEVAIPQAGTPNVVVILLDDTGIAHLGCFGSPIATPNFDRLASAGLRFANFHTTALCSPSRACLLTGRNHHAVGMRAISNFDTGFPNMRGRITPSAATLAEMLTPQGWSTFCVGKWHLAPPHEASAAGPFHNWPLQKGFERFYGFMMGETDHFHPDLFADNHPIEAPARPEEGYHLSEDLVDQAISMVRNQKSLVPEKPFFLYLPFGATHAPHQAPEDYLKKYRGAFDEGWDIWRARVHRRQLELGIIPEGTDLAPRNPGVKPWKDLSDLEQRFACRLQEAFAAFLEHTDAQVGRLLDALETLGLADDTLTFALSDNGASQEGNDTGLLDEFRYFNGLSEDMSSVAGRIDDIGTRRSHSNYPWGWAQVGNTPAKRYKQNTHGGGVRDPLIVSWPGGLEQSARGQIRHQFHHITDIVPTILEVCGYEAPTAIKGIDQQPIDGISMAYAFAPGAEDLRKVPSRKKHQYFEMLGHRGIWSEGWKAVTYHTPGTRLEDDEWELYHLALDHSECHDLAKAQPEKLAELIEIFWSEAERHGVLPIDPGDWREMFAVKPIAGAPRNRERFVYHPPIQRVEIDAAPPWGARSWRMRAHIDRGCEGADGVLLAVGSVNNGLVIYIDEGHLVYEHNYFTRHTLLRSPAPLPTGRLVVGVDQERIEEGPALSRLWVGDDPVAKGKVAEISAMISSIGMTIGSNPTGISEAYRAPFPFQGQIERVEVETRPFLKPEDESALAILTALGSQ
ncbi:MAG: arylsulfatase [Rhodospirillales bacterium]